MSSYDVAADFGCQGQKDRDGCATHAACGFDKIRSLGDDSADAGGFKCNRDTHLNLQTWFDLFD